MLRETLRDEPTLRSVELLHRARLAGYTGAEAIYALAQTLRTRDVTPLVRFEGLAGEFSQHDFGEVLVRYLDGTEEKIHFFASRLKYSRWVEVTIVRDQRVEALVRTLVEHLAAFGAFRWSRSSTGRRPSRSSGTATASSPSGIPLRRRRPRLGARRRGLLAVSAPKQKGSVENLVGWVKGSFFKQRRFLDREDLRATAPRVAGRGQYAPPFAGHGRIRRPRA